MARFVLDQRKVIYGAGYKDPLYAKHWGREHFGTDYSAYFIPFYAPLNVRVFGLYGDPIKSKGGLWLEMVVTDGPWIGYTIRSAHFYTYLVQRGNYKEGTRLATTGNSGTWTTGPHLHLEVRMPDGTLIDPELFFNQILMIDYAQRYNGLTIITSEKGPEEGKWYWVTEGKKYLIPDPMTGWAFGLLDEDVKFTSEKAIANIPTGPQLQYWDGSYFRFVENIYKRKKHLKK